MSLPTDDKARKALPIFRGPLMYFPDAMLALAAVCRAGNDQHNLGEQMHWAREKSVEQMDTALRHMMDHGTGQRLDTDGMWHLAKAAWRILAELQLSIEETRGEITRGMDGVPRTTEQAVPEPIEHTRLSRVARVQASYARFAESETKHPTCALCGETHENHLTNSHTYRQS